MQTIVAAFDDQVAARSAVERLVAHGIDRQDVHVETAQDDSLDAGSSTSTSTSTGSGVASNAGEHEGLFSRVGDFFRNLFGDAEGEPHADPAGRYSEAVRRGNTVVIVDLDDGVDPQPVRQLLGEAGSVDIDERAAQWHSAGWMGFDPNAAPLTDADRGASSGASIGASTGTTGGVTQGETVLPVVQEELQVGKRVVDGGTVRVVKRVSETPVRELVRLRQERATVERRPVDRPATAADVAGFEDATIEVRESSEEAVVAKTAHVIEEVVVGKEVTERAEAIDETVRRTDVEVERGTSGGTAVPGGSTLPDRPDTDTTGRTGTTGRETLGMPDTSRKGSGRSGLE